MVFIKVKSYPTYVKHIVLRIRCKNCVKCGKGLNFVQIKLLSCRSSIDLVTFRKLSTLFVCQYGCFKQKDSHWKGKLEYMSCLQLKKNGCKSWKELIKRIKIDLGTTLTGSIDADIFNPKDTSTMLSQHFEPVLVNFEALGLCKDISNPLDPYI